MKILDMPGHLVRRLHQKSTQVFHVHARAAGVALTPVQFAAMDAIRARPGLDQAAVSCAIAYDRATIGGVLDRLVQKGYVQRRVSKRDRRARELELTPLGHEEYDRALQVVRSLQESIFSELTQGEREKLITLLRKATSASYQDDASSHTKL